MASMNIRSGDTVVILTGGEKDRGQKGRVIVADPKSGTVIVENRNMVTKHIRPRSAQEQGGKVERPRPIDVSNVMLVCPKCGEPTKVGHVMGDHGKFIRCCKRCGAKIDVKEEKKQVKKATKSAKTSAKSAAKPAAKKSAAKKAEKTEE